MVVLAVVGVVAMIAVPRVTALVSRRNANTAGLRVQKIMEAARDQAREERRCVSVGRGSTASKLNVTVRPMTGGACDMTGGAPREVELGARFISLPNSTLDFGITGSVITNATDFVDYTFDILSEGIRTPRTLRIYKALGLVRKR